MKEYFHQRMALQNGIQYFSPVGSLRAQALQWFCVTEAELKHAYVKSSSEATKRYKLCKIYMMYIKNYIIMASS